MGDALFCTRFFQRVDYDSVFHSFNAQEAFLGRFSFSSFLAFNAGNVGIINIFFIYAAFDMLSYKEAGFITVGKNNYAALLSVFPNKAFQRFILE